MDTPFPHMLEPPYDRWVDADIANPRLRQLARDEGMPYAMSDKTGLGALHDGSIRYADDGVRQIPDTLSSLGLRENTMVIMGADHGDALGEDGVTVGHPIGGTFDELLCVPLIMAGPGVSAGTRAAQMTQNTDIFPTLMELLGIETSA